MQSCTMELGTTSEETQQPCGAMFKGKPRSLSRHFPRLNVSIGHRLFSVLEQAEQRAG